MSYRLFLDDVRNPYDVKWVVLPLGPWVIVRSYEAFVKEITEHGLPEFIAFDHDLSDEHVCDYILNGRSTGKLNYDKYQEKTGMDCAKWLVEYCMNTGHPLPFYIVHSMNSIGRENINSYLTSFNRSRGV